MRHNTWWRLSLVSYLRAVCISDNVTIRLTFKTPEVSCDGEKYENSWNCGQVAEAVLVLSERSRLSEVFDFSSAYGRLAQYMKWQRQ